MSPRCCSGLALVVAMTLLGATCAPRTAPRSSPAVPPAHAREWSATVRLHGKLLELHLSTPRPPVSGDVLVLYASGDGGWFGAAVDMFHQIARAGYFTVGFSSRAFLKIERPHGALVSSAQLADEYEEIVAQARALQGLDPAAPAVLTGWSRGAAFAVLVASEPVLREHLVGVVAIGLAGNENLGISGAAEGTDDDSQGLGEKARGAVDTYARIGTLGSLRCAVIQSTHDGYLPASRARELFGPDMPNRRLYAIDARNHRFSGGKGAFDVALADALRWMVSLP